MAVIVLSAFVEETVSSIDIGPSIGFGKWQASGREYKGMTTAIMLESSTVSYLDCGFAIGGGIFGEVLFFRFSDGKSAEYDIPSLWGLNLSIGYRHLIGNRFLISALAGTRFYAGREIIMVGFSAVADIGIAYRLGTSSMIRFGIKGTIPFWIRETIKDTNTMKFSESVTGTGHFTVTPYFGYGFEY